jgi:hypothetical protein
MAACCGCGDGPSSSTEEASVRGVVTVNGTPASGGVITFKSANINRHTDDVAAEIGEDGTYTIKALVGENLIRVTPSKKLKKPVMYSVDVYEVKSGDNEHDVKLVSQ